MCGRYVLAQPNDIYDRFEIERGNFELNPNYNVAPSMQMPVIAMDHTLQIMKWGLIPYWEKDPTPKNQLINARAESVAVKPSFKKNFATQRCIVPATGFYEWKKTQLGKIPYYFRLKDDQMFGFAGLFDTWRNHLGQVILTYLIITTEPNETMKPIHNRMPVILSYCKVPDFLDSLSLRIFGRCHL